MTPPAATPPPRRVGPWGPRPAGTIWGSALADEVPRRFQWIYTVLLPVVYSICFLFGASSALVILPSVAAATSPGLAHFIAILIGVLGPIAFFALAARLEPLEFYVDVPLAFAILFYPGTLLITGLAGEWARIPGGIGMILLVIVPAARAIDIVRTARRRIASAPPASPKC